MKQHESTHIFRLLRADTVEEKRTREEEERERRKKTAEKEREQ